ncbi:MAG: D-alanyl-D-alanine carboxypeptidase [Clostridia bacterium]|nr:D-alanyl-D-alanine carboxypeptidase [Clostridia bacterium]
MKRKLFSAVTKKNMALLSALLLVFFSCASLEVSAAPALSGEAAILIDGKTGNVLYEKNSEKVMFPASTTKIMTAIVALDAVEKGEISLDQPLVLQKEAFDTLDPDGSSVGLKVGEEMKLLNLLEGLLIASGNDAAVTIAQGVSGSIEAFVARMNEKAKELGLSSTRFENPHGLHNPQHYTTAYDMSQMAYFAMKNETFRNIVECAHIYLPATNMSDKRYFINTNNLVSRMRYPYYFYDYATGIKTGSTSEAGYCLVASAEMGDKSVISVLFNAEDISVSHNESKELLEFGLTEFKAQRLAKRDDIFGEVKVKQAADGTDHILLSAEENLDALFPKDGDTEKVTITTEIPEKVYAPIRSGQVIGKAIFSYEGKKVGEVNLISTVELDRHFLGFVSSFGEWLWNIKVIRLVVYVLLGLVLGFVALIGIGFVRAIKKSKRKRRRSSGYHPPRY